MAEALIRKYEIKIGRNSELINRIKSPSRLGDYSASATYEFIDILTDYSYQEYDVIARNRFDDYVYGYNDINVIPAKSLTINDVDQGLHIEVKIVDNKNTKTTSTQQAKLMIYNLGKNNRDFIRVGDSVFIKAGWESDGEELPLLYVGQVDSIKTERQAPNTITEILLKPAQILEDLKINRSYPPLTTVRQVIDDLLKIAASKGLPTGQFFKTDAYLAILNREYPFGITIHGHLVESLEELCSQNGYKAYIVQGKLYVHPVNYAEYRKVVNITENLLRSSIEIEEDAAGDTSTVSGSSKGKGLRIRVALNGDITTNTIVKLGVAGFEGSYTVSSVEHEMEYEGQQWDTVLSLTQIQ